MAGLTQLETSSGGGGSAGRMRADAAHVDVQASAPPQRRSGIDAANKSHIVRGRSHGAWLRGLLLPTLVLLGLEVAGRAGWMPRHLMPMPSDLLTTLLELAEGPLWKHVFASSARVFAGFSIGALLALGLGALVGFSRLAEDYIEPSFQALRAVPGLAWVPLLLIWLGIDETSKVTLIAIGAFFPIYVNLVAGIRNVDRKLAEVGAMVGFSRLTLVHRIFLPAALPYLFTGLRSGLSMAWLCVVAAELLAATRGIGYLLTDGREVSRPDLVLVAILVLALMGKLSDSVLKTWERRSLHWRDVFEGART